MDRIDRMILSALQDNARISNIDLASEVGLSPSACLRRVSLLEKSGVIQGYQWERSRPRQYVSICDLIPNQEFLPVTRN